MKLRARVVVVALAAAIGPVVMVGLSGLYEQTLVSGIRDRLSNSALETGRLLDSGQRSAEEVVEAQARTYSVRIRVIAPAGSELDVDFDRGAASSHRIGQLFFGPDGAPSLRAFDDTLGPLVERAELRDAVVGQVTTGCRTSPGAKLLVCHAVLERADGSAIYAQESSRLAVRALYDLRYQLLRLSLLMMPIAIAIALLLGRGMVKPIRLLGAQARASSKDPRPGARLDEVGDDEVRDLAQAFNGLLARLEDRQKQNEAFAADLVHEIKNPLATVRAASEAMAGGPMDAARAARLARALSDAGGRLDGIVTQFLELARAEGGWSADERTPVDLAALASRVADACHARREEVALSVDAPDPVVLNGVAHGLDAMVRNLIENAFSFAVPRDGAKARVEVAVRASGSTALLSVADTGPGIPDEDLGRVFERFFTTRDRERGTGLGLALVRAAVEAHGGTIAATSGVTGTTFVVRIPMP